MADPFLPDPTQVDALDLSTPAEPEVLAARRAFPKAQELLAGGARRRISSLVEVGWHDIAAHPERGAFALVRRTGPYEELVGEILMLTYEDRPTIFVYCVNTADVPQDITVYRRAFIALARPARTSIPCTVEVRA